MHQPASIITFLYFDDLDAAKRFFSTVLGLEVASDQGFAVIWKVGATGFVGAVDARRGSIPVRSRGGTLVSLNVDDVQAWHEKMARAGVSNLTQVTDHPAIGLRSFFFKGPEGYDFEIQEFVRPEDRRTFLPQ